MLFLGDQFFKFQDIEEITSEEIGNILEEMHRRKRYKQVLLVADTCQAFTLGDHITAPNVMVIGSSLRGESSYAHHSDQQLGLSVIERYTHGFMQFIKKKGGIAGQAGNMTIQEAMVDPYPYASQRAHVGFRKDLVKDFDVDTIRISDFFANNEPLSDTDSSIQLVKSSSSEVPSMQAWPLQPKLEATRRQLTTEPSAPVIDIEDDLVDSLPVYNPSDGPFLAMVLVLLVLVTLVSRPR